MIDKQTAKSKCGMPIERWETAAFIRTSMSREMAEAPGAQAQRDRAPRGVG
jgi:hypothetical protein